MIKEYSEMADNIGYGVFLINLIKVTPYETVQKYRKMGLVNVKNNNFVTLTEIEYRGVSNER